MEINTAFNIGNIVWFFDGSIKQAKITEINVKINNSVYKETYFGEYYDGEEYIPVELDPNKTFSSIESLCNTLKFNAWRYEEHYDNFYDIALNHNEIEDFYAYQDENNENLDLEATIDAINSSDSLKLKVKKDEDGSFTVIFK